jgi:hypothetical protein
MREYKIAFIYPCSNLIGYTLVHSLIRILRAKGHKIFEFNTIDSANIYNPEAALVKYDTVRSMLNLTVVLDLGYLDDERLYHANNNHPILLLAGDNPQSFDHSYLTKIKTGIRNILKPEEPYFGKFLGHRYTCIGYSHILTSDLDCIKHYRKRSVNVQWFPYWADSSVYNKSYLSDNPRLFDIVTVMNPRPNRIHELSALEKSKDIQFSNKLNVYHRKAAAHYASGLLVFNKSNYGEYTMRIPESMAVGSMLITDFISPSKGLYEHFEPGRDIETYTSTDELLDKVKFYSKNEAVASKIAESGYCRIINNHLEEHRASYLLNFALND